jgi:hypothetical protein
MASRARKYATKTTVINFRIQPSTKAALQAAASRSGRTVSAECEHQLRRALSEIGTGPTHALMALIGRAIDGVVGLKSPTVKWWNDPRQFDEAVRLATAAFELLRPPPRAGAEPPDSGEPLSERSIQFAAEASVREVQTVDAAAVPFEQQTPDQRWLALLRQDLGSVLDRVLVWGASAQEARRLRKATQPFIDELQALSKKSAKTPKAMTQAEAQRLLELQRQLLEAARPKGESHAR